MSSVRRGGALDPETRKVLVTARGTLIAKFTEVRPHVHRRLQPSSRGDAATPAMRTLAAFNILIVTVAASDSVYGDGYGHPTSDGALSDLGDGYGHPTSAREATAAT